MSILSPTNWVTALFVSPTNIEITWSLLDISLSLPVITDWSSSATSTAASSLIWSSATSTMCQECQKYLGHHLQSCYSRLCPTLPFNDSVCLRLNIFFQTVLGLCYSFLSWYTDVSRRWQTAIDVLNFAVVQSLKRPASDRDWRFSHVTQAFVWRFHRYSGGTLPVSRLSLLLGRRTARVT